MLREAKREEKERRSKEEDQERKEDTRKWFQPKSKQRLAESSKISSV